MKKSILGAFCLLFVWTAIHGRAQGHPFTGMVSFGDSLSDLGNTVTTLSVFVQRHKPSSALWLGRGQPR